MLFNGEFMTKLSGMIPAEDYERFSFLVRKVSYKDLVDSLNEMINDKCVQKIKLDFIKK